MSLREDILWYLKFLAAIGIIGLILLALLVAVFVMAPIFEKILD